MRAESVTFHGALGNEPRLLLRQVTLGQKFHSRPQLLCGHDWFRLGEVGSVCQTSAAAKIAEDSEYHQLEPTLVPAPPLVLARLQCPARLVQGWSTGQIQKIKKSEFCVFRGVGKRGRGGSLPEAAPRKRVSCPKLGSQPLHPSREQCVGSVLHWPGRENTGLTLRPHLRYTDIAAQQREDRELQVLRLLQDGAAGRNL